MVGVGWEVAGSSWLAWQHGSIWILMHFFFGSPMFYFNDFLLVLTPELLNCSPLWIPGESCVCVCLSLSRCIKLHIYIHWGWSISLS